MLLDAHGGAVAAGGHGLRRAAAAGVMGLCCCCGGAGRSAGVLCSAPGSLQHWGVSEAERLCVYGALFLLSTAILLASGMLDTSKQRIDSLTPLTAMTPVCRFLLQAEIDRRRGALEI